MPPIRSQYADRGDHAGRTRRCQSVIRPTYRHEQLLRLEM